MVNPVEPIPVSHDGSQPAGPPASRSPEGSESDGLSALKALVDSLDVSVVARLAGLVAVVGEMVDELMVANRELVKGAARAAGEAARQVARTGEPPTLRTLLGLARDRRTLLGLAFVLHFARELGGYLESRARGMAGT